MSTVLITSFRRGRGDAILRWAIEQPAQTPPRCLRLGNLLFDKRRHQDAIDVWRYSSRNTTRRFLRFIVTWELQRGEPF